MWVGIPLFGRFVAVGRIEWFGGTEARRKMFQSPNISVIMAFAATGMVSLPSVAQIAFDPVVEEPIRSQVPGRDGPAFDDVILPAGSDALALGAARCGAAGAMMPVLLLVTLGIARTRRPKSLEPGPHGSRESPSLRGSVLTHDCFTHPERRHRRRR